MYIFINNPPNNGDVNQQPTNYIWDILINQKNGLGQAQGIGIHPFLWGG